MHISSNIPELRLDRTKLKVFSGFDDSDEIEYWRGHSRSTNDIDFFISGDEDNAEKMVAALTDFGLSSSQLSADMFTKKDSLVVMGVEPMAVDILNYCKGVNFEDAYPRRVVIEDEGLKVNIIGYHDLMANKRAVDRLKDRADVEYLERIHST